MVKTLGQSFFDNIMAKGFTYEEAQSLTEMMKRNATIMGETWGFDIYCEENKIRPTWFRYKKYRKLQEEKLKIYINSGGKDDRF